MILDIFNSVVNSYFIYDGVITHFGGPSSSSLIIHQLDDCTLQAISTTSWYLIGVGLSLLVDHSWLLTHHMTGINAGMVYLPAGIVFNISPIRPRRYCGNCELNWTILHLIHRLISISSILKAVIAIMVQFFFAWRIQVLVRKWYLTSVIVAISLAGLGGSYFLLDSNIVLRWQAMALVTNWIVIKTPRYSDFPQWKVSVLAFETATARSRLRFIIPGCGC